MRRALTIAALLPLTLVSASGAAQLALPGGGIGLPDVGAPVERVVGALPLADIVALPPAQAARALLTVLRARGIAVPDAARERILAQKDPERLERWLEKAVVANSLSAIFDEPN